MGITDSSVVLVCKIAQKCKVNPGVWDQMNERAQGRIFKKFTNGVDEDKDDEIVSTCNNYSVKDPKGTKRPLKVSKVPKVPNSSKKFQNVRIGTVFSLVQNLSAQTCLQLL